MSAPFRPSPALALGLAVALLSAAVSAAAPAAAKPEVKKKIVYRSHTQIDLTGDTVEGKVRAPEVFYIFQRKRTESHHVVKTPEDFEYHHDGEVDSLRRALPQ